MMTASASFRDPGPLNPEEIDTSQLHDRMGGVVAPEWYALVTMPQHEKAVTSQLEMRQFHSYLPTYKVVHTWKNRQKKTLIRPLFAGYTFIHTQRNALHDALSVPGVMRYVGTSRGPSPITEPEIAFLRSEFCRERLQPFHDLVVGKRVRLIRGPMLGVCGTLVRQTNSTRLVVTLHLINQNAALEVDGADLEPVAPEE
jgi:transcription antitermination factor NusG